MGVSFLLHLVQVHNSFEIQQRSWLTRQVLQDSNKHLGMFSNNMVPQPGTLLMSSQHHQTTVPLSKDYIWKLLLSAHGWSSRPCVDSLCVDSPLLVSISQGTVEAYKIIKQYPSPLLAGK